MLELIKKIAENKKISISKLISEIEMTESGFYAMFRNDSVKIKTLQKIANVLDVEIGYFFGNDEESAQEQNQGSNDVEEKASKNVPTESSCVELEKELEYLKREMEHLKELVRMKDRYINLIEKQLK